MPLTLDYGKKIRSASFVACAFVVSVFPVAAQKSHWRAMRNEHLITFDWNCAQSESFPKTTLSKVVYRSIKTEDRGLPGVWGDRAFIFRPRRGAVSTYFVPTVCGATGNCVWQLYTTNPVRYLGEISGQFVYASQSSKLPVIVTYTHMSASEGILATYVFERGKYRWLRDEYPIGYEIQPGLRTNGHKMPSFLERALRQCKNYGG